MNTLLIYMVKAAVYLAGFYIIYFVFLSKDTNYTRNRAYIVLSVITALIFPLISVNVREQSTAFYFGKTLSEVFVTANLTKNSLDIAPGHNPGFIALLVKVYFAVMILFAIKLSADILNLIFLIIRNREQNTRIIYFSGFNTSGFSAMGYIFINKSLGDSEAEEIIRHEQNHLRNNHFLDILLIETIKVFQWFNPFIYLINRSLRAVHEYEADRGCLQSGMAVINYQNLLIKNVFRSGRFSISNSFSNPSLIKKRMLMMVKKPSGKSSNLKILLVIPVAALFLSTVSSCERNLKKTESVEQTESSTGLNAKEGTTPAGIPEYEAPPEVFVVVEEMPQFPGGDSELMKFVYSNIVYPEKAKEQNIQGRVILRFCVTYKGGVDQVQVLKPIDPELDNEAIRVIKMLPAWVPGKQGGKPVNVWYSVPVTFQLKNI